VFLLAAAFPAIGNMPEEFRSILIQP